MERVTDEWIEQAWRDASKITQLPIPRWHMPRAFAQAVARECVRLCEQVENTPTPTLALDHWGAKIVAERIRARFGLED